LGKLSDRKQAMNTRLKSFQNKLEQQLEREFKNYAEMHQYSV